MSQDDDKLQAVSEHDHESPEQLSPKPSSPNTRVEWDSTLPLAQQLRQTLKYDHVYPSSPVEWGSTGPAGQISSSWYSIPFAFLFPCLFSLLLPL